MPLQLQLAGQTKDLGEGLIVRRLLPSPQRQAVGPFLFLDHFGPLNVVPGGPHDVRAHPHIGIATVTYLFEGAMLHRDSLGVVQRIEPGALNWMTAGRGIVHSERVPDDLRHSRYVNHGLQLWAALPRSEEECEPGFTHTPAQELPEFELPGLRAKLLIGTAFGRTSPVKTFSDTCYLDLQFTGAATLDLPVLAQELAVYGVDQGFTVDGVAVPPHTLALLAPGQVAQVVCEQACRVMVLGGAPLDAPRFMWWNFVSSRKDRIARAAQDWSAHAFGYAVGETELLPLPERRELSERRRKQRSGERRG